MTRVSANKANSTPIFLGKSSAKGSQLSGVRSKRTLDLERLRTRTDEWKLKSYKGEKPLEYSGDSHLLTVAPTGSGKGRCAIIPNLLTYDGPVVVVDPKGENYAVTARARREQLGHSVYCLDPFNVAVDSTDSLNPFDIFSLKNTDVESDSQMIADMLSLESTGLDAFWDINACALLSGVIAYLATQKDKSERHISEMVRTTHSDDVVYNLAVVLDTVGKKLPKMAYGEISSFLQKADKERSGVLSTANSYLKAFGSERVSKSLSSSSFNIDHIVQGKPITIYLIVPPDKLNSHKALLRLWVGTIMRAITARREIPLKRTLFVLDECAQLGHFSLLETAITLCRGYGLQTWTFWQDLSQIEKLYEVGWHTMVNNCGVVQVFGAKNHSVVRQCSELLGIDIEDLRRIQDNEQVTVINGEPTKSFKIDYLRDEMFSGLYCDNPYYKHSPLSCNKEKRISDAS